MLLLPVALSALALPVSARAEVRALQGKGGKKGEVHYDVADGCTFHDYTVHASEMTMSFSFLLADQTGWHSIRADNNWDYGDVQVKLFNGQLFFALAGNYPSEHWFGHIFDANVLYDISLDYSSGEKTVSLTVDGQHQETKEFWASRCVCITPGYVGCWQHEGTWKDVLNGTVSNLEISARGVHQMRYDPEDRPPATVGPTTTAAIVPVIVASEGNAAVQYDVSDSCQFHDYEVHANEITMSWSMIMTDKDGWQTIRNDDGWDYGDVHVMMGYGKLYFALAGNYPSEHWFSHDFETNVQYQVSVDYSKESKSVSLTVDGKVVEQKEYWGTRCVCITPGHIGCWQHHDGSLRNHFNGTIHGLQIAARGVHQMRNSPRDREPAFGLMGEAGSSPAFYIILVVVISFLLTGCAAVAVLWKRKQARLVNQNQTGGEALAEEEVVGRPLQGYEGKAEEGKCVPEGKKDEKPYVTGFPVMSSDADPEEESQDNAVVVRVVSSRSTSPKENLEAPEGLEHE
mmetsp:Transcript_12040/g.21360  ORF Transcript_12040/g.21360 Transcript_12040/m.21360 type:complete len:514 (-) Transcript_12040:233-1774(-)